MRSMIRLAAFTVAVGFASASQATIISTDITGGGQFSDSVMGTDGWANDNGQGDAVDFWTFSADAGDSLSFSVSGDTDFGLSLYSGAISFSDLVSGGFDNDADFGSLSFVDGNNPNFGPFNSLDWQAAATSSYTLAVGGAAQGFGIGDQHYELSFDQQAKPVPEPSSLAAMLGGAFALIGVARRRRLS